jgi:hypothetical protein
MGKGNDFYLCRLAGAVPVSRFVCVLFNVFPFSSFLFLFSKHRIATALNWVLL